PENKLKLEVDFLVSKKTLGGIITKCYMKHGATKTSIMLDKIKAKGYHYSTIGAITISTSDMVVPESKRELLEKYRKTSRKNTKKCIVEGLYLRKKDMKKVIDLWTKTTEDVANALMESL
ncbi:hypothetical protein AK964_23010, partial [Clostridium butyricum]